jgi:type I restriction enzyme R subunit
VLARDLHFFLTPNAQHCKIHAKAGTHSTPNSALFFDQLVEAAVKDDSLQQAAEANPIDKFELVFRKVLESLFIERMDMNESIFARFVNDPEFQDVIARGLAEKVYARLPKTVKHPKPKAAATRRK